MHGVSRVVAFVTGIALLIGGINFAADLGDIVLAIPMVVLGGLHMLDAIVNHYPHWSKFAVVSGFGLLLGGINFVDDLWSPVVTAPMLLLAGIQLLYAMTRHLRSGSALGYELADPPNARWS